MTAKSRIALVVIVLITNLAQAQSISSFLHVDQFGYLPNAAKIAVITNPQIGYNATDIYQPGQVMELRNASNDKVVFTNSVEIWNSGATHEQSGDKGWWFDFSDYDAVGSYYVFDPTTNHRSAIFDINSNPYTEVIQAATKMFYYNRCNAPKEAPYAQPNWTDTDNFSQDVNVRFMLDQNNAATSRDLTGGWFDAGDYNKYVTFAHDPVHQLLTSFENNPDIFTDDWNIPESNNGIPDLLDEIKWELDWLHKMINNDGTVILKMGSLDYDINSDAPPSNNHSPRYYTPTCSSASLSIASTHAHAAKVYANIPSLASFSNALASDAILCWNKFLDFYDNDNLETNCDDQTIKAGDADWDEQDQINTAIVAAVYLFDLTGDMQYSNFVRDNIHLSDPFINYFFAAHHTIFLEAILHYSTLDNAAPSTVNQIFSLVESAVYWDNLVSIENGLYRVDLPDWSYYWGSNMTVANFANLSLTFRKYNANPALSNDLHRKASEVLHYFHGINPQGLVYLSNMYDYGAERSVNEVSHSWFVEGSDWDNAVTSLYGPAPGFLSGGANQAYTGSLTPPANQPIQKSYLDYNDWFTDPAYEITEPAIYYQAAYIQLLSNFVTTDIIIGTSQNDADDMKLDLFPNPNNGVFTLAGNIHNREVQVLNINSKYLYSIYPKASTISLDLTDLEAGVYMLRVIGEHGEIGVRKVVVQ